jgi:hypothetical protein
MKQKIIKISAILIAISLFFGGCMSESLTFEVNRIVLEETLDFTNYRSALAASAAASYYKDEDGSFVLWLEDSSSRNYADIEESDPNYDETNNQYLIRMYPGESERTKIVEIREWISVQEDTRITEFVFPSAMWQNNRGNTVVHYTRVYSNPAVPSERGNSQHRRRRCGLCLFL